MLRRGAYYAGRFTFRYLVIDVDPQCNATILTLGEDRAAPLYWNNSPSEERERTTNLWTILEPIELGEPSISSTIQPIEGASNRFGFDLIPGHPRVSIIEDRLSQAWRDTQGGDVGGLRKTNWVITLGRQLSNQYDLVILDLGPSLGSLNRTALLGSDYFVTPMGADIFSILGLRNISTWLHEWTAAYLRGLETCDRTSPGASARFGLAVDLPILKGFAGYTVQAYIAKFKQGEKRPTNAFERITSSFQSEVLANLRDFFPPSLTVDKTLLGEIPNMYSLIPLAQTASAPIIDLKSSDGLVGSHYIQAKRYVEILDTVTNALSCNIGLQVN
ncbi:ParA family protein [Azotobacter chroococcum]|nr:ParA family protein [Azotobacter chroococcum]